jgi:chorismate mutase
VTADPAVAPTHRALRDRLDALDRRLVELLAERGRVIDEVIAYKRAAGVAAVDPDRERRMLDAVADEAVRADLDPRVARTVLRAVLDAFGALEAEVLGPPDPTASPAVPGRVPVVRGPDDPEVPWQAVKAQRNADGSVAEVRERWFAFSADPPYLSLLARYDPGMVVRRHGHFSPHVVYVIEGGATFGDRWCGAGTHLELPFGAAFGPVTAGPDGAVFFEVMLGDPRSWGDDPAAFDRALAEAGATPLPDPPLEFPAWLADLRRHWAGTPAGPDGT